MNQNINSFESKEIHYENHTDKWGSFRAVHIPITLENSQIIVMTAEISMEAFNKVIDDIKHREPLIINYQEHFSNLSRNFS